MAWRGCVEDDVHERLPPCRRLDAVAPPSLARRLSQSDRIVNMKAARELGARHVSPATDRRGRLHFLVSASCRFAGMAAPRRFLYDEAAATLHRILTTNISANRQARGRLKEDLARVLEALPFGGLSVDLALEAAIGVVLQVLAAIGEGRLKGAVAQPAVGAVLGGHCHVAMRRARAV